jgi:dihydroorotase
MRKAIVGGYMMDPKTDMEGYYDILIEDKTILKLVEKGMLDAQDYDEVIDAAGKTIFPGFIDLHVHLREPGFEHKETIKTGSMACAKGGYTTVACMPNTNPVIDSVERLKVLNNIIKKDAVIEILPICAITHDIMGETLTDHESLFAQGVFAISDDGKTTMNSELMTEAFKNSRLFDRVVITHSEDHQVSEQYKDKIYPIDAETSIVKRDIELCRREKGRLHVAHVSGADAIEAIRKAKSDGVDITCEAAPHHFALNDEIVDIMDPKSKVNPPIRSEIHRKALIEGLKDGTIDIIATDHAPHEVEVKSGTYEKAAFGISGIETAFSVAYTTLVKNEGIPLMSVVGMMTFKPAEIAKLERVGSIQEGYYADIVIVDLNEKHLIDAQRFISKGKNTPFDGMNFEAGVNMTIFRGEVVYTKLNLEEKYVK